MKDNYQDSIFIPMRQWLNGLKNDESLMLAYQRGDLSAFETLYSRYKDSLFGFISRQCPVQWVEDIVQETWMAVVDRASTYQPSARFKTYLYTIAHNKSVDRWRSHKPAANEVEMESLAITANDKPETQLAFEQALAVIRSLPGEQRDAFLLQEQGFSLADIAQITGVGKETVKSRLRYATRTLRQHFEVRP